MPCRPVPSTLFVFLLAGVLFPVTTAAQDGQNEKDSVESPDATVYLDGLACPFCAYGVEKKLNKLGAIRKMEVQLEKGRVLLAFKEGESLTKKQLQTAVKEAGFTARKIEFPERSSSASSPL